MSVYKDNGFKLISLDILENTLLGKSDLKYEFIDDKEENQFIYTTVIIGPNGTGKSNLFRIIIELFKELKDLASGKKRTGNVDGRFNLKYQFEGNIYEYTNIIYLDGTFRLDGQPELDEQNPDKSNRVYLRINNKREAFSKAGFPESIVANSVLITDKFPFFKNERNDLGESVDAFPIYKYLGIRNLAQNASTRAYVRRTVQFIVEQFERGPENTAAFMHVLQRASQFLELKNSISIYYHTINSGKFFKGDLFPDILHEYFAVIKEKYSTIESNPPFKLNHYLKIKDNAELLTAICSFCNSLVVTDRLESTSDKRRLTRTIKYDLLQNASFEQLSIDYPMLEQLRQLGMISTPEIQFEGTGSYSLQESSSGEYHFFSFIVGLMATISLSNNLVMIDEPEISLHPNWQMKYLSFLQELFEDNTFGSCHMLIATHSHFLVSDLKGSSSKIIGLKRMNGKIATVDLPESINTFGWSAENVLLNIFNVPTTRNYFVADRIGEILDLISRNNRDEELIRKKVLELYSLNVINLNENDPLKPIWDKIVNKYG